MNLTPTSFGNVSLLGEGKRVLLVVHGLGASGVLPSPRPLAHLMQPTIGGPVLKSYRVEDIAAAFDEAVAARLPGADIVLMGISFGAAVALSMKSPVQRVVLVEPFLSPDRPVVQNWASRARGEQKQFALEALDPSIRYEIRATAPIFVLAGSGIGSLTEDSDLAALGAAGAKHRRVAGNHDLPRENPSALAAYLSEHDDDEPTASRAAT